MTTADPSRSRVRSIFAALIAGLSLLGLACFGETPNQCANVGCGPVPLCGAGCTSVCGCCTCLPGERSGDLVCADQGCYASAPASDAGTDADAAADATNDAPADGGWTAPLACTLPFEAGPCEALFQVYAFVDGACVPRTYGGCQGNENRFSSFEECMATCVGPPQGACPPNRVEREICLQCGAAGGCSKKATVCALVCTEGSGMSICASQFSCYDGVCQVVGCI